jgi:hypothetical protein
MMISWIDELRTVIREYMDNNIVAAQQRVDNAWKLFGNEYEERPDIVKTLLSDGTTYNGAAARLEVGLIAIDSRRYPEKNHDLLAYTSSLFRKE